jgi:hypothetical protein
MAASESERAGCKTIAATETKEIGEKCDQDELTAIKTNLPFVEHEPDGFDITMPLHDASGAVIATVGMDFNPEPGQQEETVVNQAKRRWPRPARRARQLGVPFDGSPGKLDAITGQYSTSP